MARQTIVTIYEDGRVRIGEDGQHETRFSNHDGGMKSGFDKSIAGKDGYSGRYYENEHGTKIYELESDTREEFEHKHRLSGAEFGAGDAAFGLYQRYRVKETCIPPHQIDAHERLRQNANNKLAESYGQGGSGHGSIGKEVV